MNATNDSSTTVSSDYSSQAVTWLTTRFSNDSQIIPANDSFCRHLLYMTIPPSFVRVWDVIILCPNAIFLLYLVVKMRTAVLKLHRTSSPVLKTFFLLVLIAVFISILRCVISMVVHSTVDAHTADRVMWIILKFFLLATEISVVVFSLLFGHLDSRTSIQRVILVTFSIALAYSLTQGVLEFVHENKAFHGISGEAGDTYTLFGHGGMLFWFISSLCLTVVYVIVCFLPLVPRQRLFTLPSRKSFYLYCALMATLDAAQTIGSGLIYFGTIYGMCVVDVTAYLYFTCFAPFIYIMFLRNFFAVTPPADILFSYKSQVDDVDNDEVILPNQPVDFSVPHAAAADLVSSIDSTHFTSPSPNPLYRSTEYQSDLLPAFGRLTFTEQTALSGSVNA